MHLSNIGLGNAMILVTCDPKGRPDRVSLDEIEEFKGWLKSLNETEYGKLKQSINEKGVIVPCFAWRNGSGKWKLLDGHQRVRVIRTEGWEIDGGIPVVEIVADNERDAKEKLLAIVSRYGRVEALLREIMENGLVFDVRTDTNDNGAARCANTAAPRGTVSSPIPPCAKALVLQANEQASAMCDPMISATPL